jgi:hypothetical protein
MADPISVAIPAGTLLTVMIMGGIAYAIMQNKSTKAELQTEKKIDDKMREAYQMGKIKNIEKDVDALKMKSPATRV